MAVRAAREAAPGASAPQRLTLFPPSLTPAEFVHRWRGITTTERQSAQSHFIDVCAMVGVDPPLAADPVGEWYTFEKGLEKMGGGDGWADVWLRGHFAWEYKGRKANLRGAFMQLQTYRDSLESPPLLVVCDLDRFEIHTNFTATAKRVHEFDLAALASDPEHWLGILRDLFTNPNNLQPEIAPEEITEAAAKLFGQLAQQISSRGHDPRRVAHFLDKLLFCLFAEDAQLLPKGIIGRLIEGARRDPKVFVDGLRELFAKMSAAGGMFGAEPIDWFNGGLFDGDDVLPMERDDLKVIEQVGRLNWARIEPAIFGTLFERSLDPGQRAQLGAHYTDRQSIARLVDPVILDPLRRDFDSMQAEVTPLVMRDSPASRKKARERFDAFLDHLRAVTVLDPACGSGNFLYIALQGLKDLEWEAILWGSLVLRLPQQIPRVGPHQLKGIEINVYAAELARVTIWIGEIQWMLRHGLGYARDPILKPLDNIREQDALLDLSDPANPKEAEWPDADFIVGNPPFLGGKWIRRKLGSMYVLALFRVFGSRVSPEADFVTYWHEKGRAQIESGRSKRAGLLATQSIRAGASRLVLERIKATGDIFMAWSDEPWVLAGASVHVSFVAQDDGSESHKTLNGLVVHSINSNLTAGIDLTRAQRIAANSGIAFQGPVKVGKFEIEAELAAAMLAAPNPNGRSNVDVLRPWVNGMDITGRPRGMWIIDFGSLSESQAALYEKPFEYVRQHIRPVRLANRDRQRREAWWRLGRSGEDLRQATRGLTRIIVTPRVSKHRLFVWLPPTTLPDSRLLAFARDDDYTFGVLHSRIHELWSRATGSQLREVESGFSYTPRTTFETFPFPNATEVQREAIADAARDLDHLRQGWLNPPGLPPVELELRTLTNLYNERPTWLADAHARLDAAVSSAYAWPRDLSDTETLERLLMLNLAKAAIRPKLGDQANA